MSNILIFGGTGNVGSKLAKRLVDKGADVSIFCRNNPKSNIDGTKVILGDMLDPDSIIGALQGIDKVYLLNPVHPDEYTQALIVYNLCKRNSIKHLVYQSVISPELFKDVPHFGCKLAVENALKETLDVMPVTILRPATFMQNDLQLKNILLGSGQYINPIGNAGVLHVDTHDIADFAANILLGDTTEHNGKTYTLHCSERSTGNDIALSWSKVLSKDIQFVNQNLDDWEYVMRNIVKLPSWMSFDLRVMYEGLREREIPYNANDAEIVQKILGRQLNTYENFATYTTQSWFDESS